MPPSAKGLDLLRIGNATVSPILAQCAPIWGLRRPTGALRRRRLIRAESAGKLSEASDPLENIGSQDMSQAALATKRAEQIPTAGLSELEM